MRLRFYQCAGTLPEATAQPARFVSSEIGANYEVTPAL
jgi:hypothetical protein